MVSVSSLAERSGGTTASLMINIPDFNTRVEDWVCSGDHLPLMRLSPGSSIVLIEVLNQQSSQSDDRSLFS